jgi:hypothetical protein
VNNVGQLVVKEIHANGSQSFPPNPVSFFLFSAFCGEADVFALHRFSTRWFVQKKKKQYRFLQILSFRCDVIV